MKNSLIGFSFLLTMLFAPGAAAQEMPQIQKRLDAIERRIDFGMRDGTLSRQQVARLNKDVDQVKAMMRRARADGTATKGERRDIRDVLSRVESDLDQMRVRR